MFRAAFDRADFFGTRLYRRPPMSSAAPILPATFAKGFLPTSGPEIQHSMRSEALATGQNGRTGNVLTECKYCPALKTDRLAFTKSLLGECLHVDRKAIAGKKASNGECLDHASGPERLCLKSDGVESARFGVRNTLAPRFEEVVIVCGPGLAGSLKVGASLIDELLRAIVQRCAAQ